MYRRSVAFGLIAVWDQYSWRSAISFHHEHDALDQQTLAELRGQDRDSNRLLIRTSGVSKQHIGFSIHPSSDELRGDFFSDSQHNAVNNRLRVASGLQPEQ